MHTEQHHQLDVTLPSPGDGQKSFPDELLESLRQFDTCTLANAIEHFGVRLRNEGYTLPGLQCVTPGTPKIIGYAAPCRVRLADPPISGGGYLDRTDWWPAIEKVASPRIAVIQDIDPVPGIGASIGEVHAAILQAFRCSGAITNGSVRDVPAVGALGFGMFARNMAVSHSYMHLVDYGGEVEILGLRIHHGDLLLADCHGVLSIPRDIAPDVPAVAADIRARERRIVDVCRSAEFSVEKLQQVIRQAQQ